MDMIVVFLAIGVIALTIVVADLSHKLKQHKIHMRQNEREIYYLYRLVGKLKKE